MIKPSLLALLGALVLFAGPPLTFAQSSANTSQEIREAVYGKKSEFLRDVDAFLRATGGVAKFSDSQFCKDELMTPENNLRADACIATKNKLEVENDLSVLERWASIYDDDAAVARTTLFWHQRVIVAEERQREEQEAAIAVQKRKSVEKERFEKSVPTLDSRKLCHNFSRSRQPLVRAELQKRKLFSSDEWELIDKKQVRIGMTELALICSWGDTKRNRSVGAWGEHIQYVYPSNSFVYVENGVVTSWQD